MTLAARATDAKIRLWRIKHRRVQTAAVVLCRGVYVFIGRVELCPSSGLCSSVCRQPQWAYVGVFMYSLAGWSCKDEIGLGTWVGLCHSLREKYNSRGYSFLMFTGISAENLSLYPRGAIPPHNLKLPSRAL